MSVTKKQKKEISRPGVPSPKDLIGILNSSPDPKSWRDLSVGLSSNDRKDLRDLLFRMEKDGEVKRDNQGRYFIDVEVELQTGTVERRRKKLFFGDLPIQLKNKGRGTLLREGDKIEGYVFQGPIGDEFRVTRVMEYSKDTIVGEYREHGRYPYVESLSPHYKGRIALSKETKKLKHGDTVEVKIKGESSRGYAGEVQKVISSGRGAKHAAETLIASFSLPAEWAEEVLDEVHSLVDSPSEEKEKERRDLSELAFITIDGDDAKDFDDAVYGESLTDGWRLVVAIADVSHFVKPDTLLDQAAFQRGNSVYLPDRVIPMLPEALSNDLCSLRPGEERLCLICDIEISSLGELRDYQFYPGLIKSKARLTYVQAQKYIEEISSGEIDADVYKSITTLKSLLDKLQEVREARGALDFDPHQPVMELSKGNVVQLKPFERLDSHRMIEESMILANVCAAKFLSKGSGIYRAHKSIEPEKIESLKELFAAKGVTLSEPISALSLRNALNAVSESSEKWLLQLLVLRSIPQAFYTAESEGHFGLALEAYAHFTSPIRRYADLAVHRAIKATLLDEAQSISTRDLAVIAEHASFTERRAEDLGYRVSSWLKCDYIAPRIGEQFDGVVTGVTEFGLFVELTDHYVQGLLHVSELGDEFFHFHSGVMALVGEDSGRTFGIGEVVSVQLMDVEPALGRLDLALVSSYDGNRGGRSNNNSSGSKNSDRSRRRRRGGRGRGRNRNKKSTQPKSDKATANE